MSTPEPNYGQLYQAYDPKGELWGQMQKQFPMQIAQEKYWAKLQEMWEQDTKTVAEEVINKPPQATTNQPIIQTGWYSISSNQPVELKKTTLEHSIDVMRATTPQAKVWRMRAAYFIDIASSVWGGVEWAAVSPNPTPFHYVFGPLLTVLASFAEFMLIDGWKKRQKLSRVLNDDPENIDAWLGWAIAWIEIIFGFLGWLLDLYTTGLMGIRLAPGPMGWALGFVLVVLTTIFEFDYHLSELGLID